MILKHWSTENKIRILITDRTAPTFLHPLPRRSQEHNTHKVLHCSLYGSKKKLCSKSDLCLSWWHSISYDYVCCCCYLPKEHLAVLSREGWTAGGATLLQQARLVGITSFNIAPHLSKSVVHWHTIHRQTTHRCNLVQRAKKAAVQTYSTVHLIIYFFYLFFFLQQNT